MWVWVIFHTKDLISLSDSFVDSSRYILLDNQYYKANKDMRTYGIFFLMVNWPGLLKMKKSLKSKSVRSQETIEIGKCKSGGSFFDAVVELGGTVTIYCGTDLI